MIYEPSMLAVSVFFAFVGITIGLSFFLGRQAKSSKGYFAAHGQIPWFVNGIAFAGDYLSAASFLGICGMIAFYGYDGFLYSIGFLAGWIVALFIVAEPMKRLGKYTFADALNTRFDSRGIKLAVGISTLVVSLFYLIPQMVGAGVLIQPLLGFSHWAGVLLVGVVVIVIVVSAGMVSTTYVQFIKGSLLVLFSAVLVVQIMQRGLTTSEGGEDGHAFRTIGPMVETQLLKQLRQQPGFSQAVVVPPTGDWAKLPLVRIRDETTGELSTWSIAPAESEGEVLLRETQTLTKKPDGTLFVNGQPKGTKKGEPELHPVGHISKLPDGKTSTGPLGPLTFLSTLRESELILWGSYKIREDDGSKTTIYYQKPTSGRDVLRPGVHPKFQGIHSDSVIDKLNFLSLMLALFCGTASLPHILIRYYTVKDEQSARKSTIVGIATIGFFYILTLYLGLGAMTSGAMDITNSNMAAPLLARSMGQLLFAIISAIAFTTVLGTVSGLIIASSGAVTHDLISHALGVHLTEAQEIRVAKITSVFVGAVAIVLGILFKDLNVGYLVGWAFSIAASANLPSLVMVLFWKGTTRYGIIAAVVVGMVSSLGWILLSGDTFAQVYGLPAESAWVPFSQPGIVTIPLGFLTLIGVSMLSRNEPTADNR